MTRKLCAAAAAVVMVLLVGFAAGSAAQTPTLTPFFTASGTWNVHCEYCDPYHPGPDYPLTVYFILTGFDAYLSAIEFSVDYPYLVTWLNDEGMPPVTFGSTPTGISMGWGVPQNALDPIIVLKADIIYHATCSHDELRIQVMPHPVSGALQAVRFGDNALVELAGGAAKFCSRSVPAEGETWGAIKALYR
ncbi:MAG: hypothetical protein P8181_00630 [bacterium]